MTILIITARNEVRSQVTEKQNKLPIRPACPQKTEVVIINFSFLNFILKRIKMNQAFSNTKQNLFSTIFVTTKEHSQNKFSNLSTPTILHSSFFFNIGQTVSIQLIPTQLYLPEIKKNIHFF